jgi:disulfide bond formation protein DsbB
VKPCQFCSEERVAGFVLCRVCGMDLVTTRLARAADLAVALVFSALLVSAVVLAF